MAYLGTPIFNLYSSNPPALTCNQLCVTCALSVRYKCALIMRYVTIDRLPTYHTGATVFPYDNLV